MESEPSRVRVALYGPTETGKSTYKAILLGENPNTVKTPTETIDTIERLRKFQEMRRGKLRPLEQYKLLLTDLSGLEDFRDERLKAIAAGVVGCLFFYDATDPSSAERLVQMVEEELLKTEYIERFLGIAILGNKISQDLSPEAVRKVEKLKDRLDSIITPVWGYETPHLLISSVKKNDVVLSFWVLESILSSKEVPEQPLAKYSATNYLKQLPEKPIRPEAPEAPTPTEEVAPEKVEAPEAPEKVEAPEAPTPTEEKLQVLNFPLKRFPSSSKAWEISKRLVDGFKGVKNSIVGRIREGNLYIGYWPKTPLEELSQNNTKLLIIFHNMVEAYEKDTLKRVIIHGENNWFTLFNRNKMVVFIQSDTKPSERLLNLF